MYESDEGIRIDKESIVSKDRSSDDDEPRERVLKPKKPRELDRDSDKMSAIRSSRDYWEDIEPKLNINAKLLDFSATNPNSEVKL
jgi:hypothetical protein